MSVEPMLSVEEAQALVLETIRPRPVERVPIADALGRVLAADVRAGTDSPPFDNSAMDGYAVRFDDVATATPDRPVPLQVIEDIPAGKVGRRAVGPAQASRIMTGAPIPEGADTVIRVEDTRAAGDRVEVLQPDQRGGSIRRRGSNMRAGAVVVPAGTPCGPGEIGVLASVQRSFAPVYGRPAVTILSTGDELVEVDEPLGPGQIVNSNSVALAAAVRAAGGDPVMLPIARDTQAAIRRSIEAALQGDFIISSGG
ncbi:MAG: molybdopterin molybdotransferase MoeA, partial [Gemmatimonadota bacterium]